MLVKDGSFGLLQPDGTMNGMIGMLANDEVDAAIDGLIIKASRAKWAQPLLPVYNTEY